MGYVRLERDITLNIGAIGTLYFYNVHNSSTQCTRCNDLSYKFEIIRQRSANR